MIAFKLVLARLISFTSYLLFILVLENIVKTFTSRSLENYRIFWKTIGNQKILKDYKNF